MRQCGTEAFSVMAIINNCFKTSTKSRGWEACEPCSSRPAWITYKSLSQKQQEEGSWGSWRAAPPSAGGVHPIHLPKCCPSSWLCSATASASYAKLWPWNALVRGPVSWATAELRKRQAEGHRVNGVLLVRWTKLHTSTQGWCAWSQEPVWSQCCYSQLKGGNPDGQSHHLNVWLLFVYFLKIRNIKNY